MDQRIAVDHTPDSDRHRRRTGPGTPGDLVNFAGAHLGLKNTLDRAKQEMDAAAKAAQAEARSKSKTASTKPKPEAKIAEAPKPRIQTSPEPTKAAGLFDAPTQAAVPMPDTNEEEPSLIEVPDEEQTGDEDGLDEAA